MSPLQSSGRGDLFAGLFLAALLIFSVTPGMASAKGSELPGWALNPPSKSADFHFAVGEGAGMAAARANALESIASTIETKVDADIEINQTSGPEGWAENFERDVRTKVRAITISDFEVDKAARVGDRTYVLVRVDLQAMAASRLTHLKEIDAELVRSMKSFSSESSFVRYKNERPLRKKLYEARKDLSVIDWADADFEIGRYSQRYIEYAGQLDTIRSDFRILVVSEEPGRLLAEKIVTLLDKKKILASRSSSGTGETTIEIRQTSMVDGSDLSGGKSAKLTVNVKTVPTKGPSHDVTITASGSSFSSTSMAQKLAWMELVRKCEEDGVSEFLGWNMEPSAR